MTDPKPLTRELREQIMLAVDRYDLSSARHDMLRLNATLTQAEAHIAELGRDVERLNQMIRETGQGQGAIDAYVAQCEEMDDLREREAKLIAACRLLWPGVGMHKQNPDAAAVLNAVAGIVHPKS